MDPTAGPPRVQSYPAIPKPPPLRPLCLANRAGDGRSEEGGVRGEMRRTRGTARRERLGAAG